MVFDLNDAAAYQLNREALGLIGIVENVDHKLESRSTEVRTEPLLSVLGKPVRISDGVLMWGEDSLGDVAERDTFVVEAAGLRRLEQTE